MLRTVSQVDGTCFVAVQRKGHFTHCFEEVLVLEDKRLLAEEMKAGEGDGLLGRYPHCGQSNPPNSAAGFGRPCRIALPNGWVSGILPQNKHPVNLAPDCNQSVPSNGDAEPPVVGTQPAAESV